MVGEVLKEVQAGMSQPYLYDHAPTRRRVFTKHDEREKRPNEQK